MCAKWWRENVQANVDTVNLADSLFDCFFYYIVLCSIFCERLLSLFSLSLSFGFNFYMLSMPAQCTTVCICFSIFHVANLQMTNLDYQSICRSQVCYIWNTEGKKRNSTEKLKNKYIQLCIVLALIAHKNWN